MSIRLSVIVALLSLGLGATDTCKENLRGFLRLHYSRAQIDLNLLTLFDEIGMDSCIFDQDPNNPQVLLVAMILMELEGDSCELRFAVSGFSTASTARFLKKKEESQGGFVLEMNHSFASPQDPSSCAYKLRRDAQTLQKRGSYVRKVLAARVEAAMQGIGPFLIRKGFIAVAAYVRGRQYELDVSLLNLLIEALQERLGDSFALFSNELRIVIEQAKKDYVERLEQSFLKVFDQIKTQAAERMSEWVGGLAVSLVVKMTKFDALQASVIESTIESLVPNYKKVVSLFFLEVINCIQEIIFKLLNVRVLYDKAKEYYNFFVGKTHAYVMRAYKACGFAWLDCYKEGDFIFAHLRDAAQRQYSRTPSTCLYQPQEDGLTLYRVTFGDTQKPECELLFDVVSTSDDQGRVSTSINESEAKSVYPRCVKTALRI